MGLSLVKAPVVYYSGEDEADIIRWRIGKIAALARTALEAGEPIPWDNLLAPLPAGAVS